MLVQELDVGTVLAQLALPAHAHILLAADRGEAPVLGNNELLAAGELVGGAAQGLDGVAAVRVTGADREQDLADVDAGNQVVRLAEGTAHAGLETIGTSARKHLIDADDVVRVGTHAQMETFLTRHADKVPSGQLVWG